MSNPNLIWASLSIPNPAKGSIPFVDIDNASIITNVLNFYWDGILNQLSVQTGGDYTGTDPINSYFQQDAYTSNSQQVQVNASWAQATKVSGHTVSTSRGTGATPLINLTGDFVGKFSGWAYTGVVPAYTEVAGVFVYTVGITAANLGGELHFVTKGYGGNITDWVTLDAAGNLFSTVAGGAALGKAAVGWKKLVLDYTISVTSGNQAINKPAGKFVIAAGASTLTLSNSLVSANSLVFCTLNTADATATFIKSVVISAGQFIITLNANATGNVTVSFLVINTDS
jgi:hypothetical protein